MPEPEASNATLARHGLPVDPPERDPRPERACLPGVGAASATVLPRLEPASSLRVARKARPVMAWPDALYRRSVWVSSACGVLSAFASTGIGWGLDHHHLRTLFASILGVLVSVNVQAVLTERNKLLQSRRVAENSVRRFLEALAQTWLMQRPSLHIRVCVMLATHNGLFRSVQSSTAFNMQHDADADLEIGFYEGISGCAAQQRRPVWVDLTRQAAPGQASFLLADTTAQAKVRKTLKSILSVPIFDPDTRSGQILGTLQVDSDEPPHKVGFDRESTWQLVQRFADALSCVLNVHGELPFLRSDAVGESRGDAVALRILLQPMPLLGHGLLACWG